MKDKLIIFSSKGGGPFKQHSLLVKELRNKGCLVEHWYGWKNWLKLHLIDKKNLTVMSNVPFLFWQKRNKLILNIHGNYNLEKNIITNPLGYLYGVNVKWAEKVIVPSEYLKKILKLDKAIVIPNFLNKVSFKKNKTKRNYVRLISVTHFAFKKKSFGVLEIIKSLEFLKTDKKVVLDIFGNGRYLDVVMKKLQENLLPKNVKVRFRGYSNKVYDELAASDIFVYWSGIDNVPMVIMEAMMVGLPIITNDFPSFKDEIKINNFCCSNKNEFANSIDLLINDKNICGEISKKNKVYAKRFLPKNSVNKFIKEIYEK